MYMGAANFQMDKTYKKMDNITINYNLFSCASNS
jgi:hypothetical protein